MKICAIGELDLHITKTREAVDYVGRRKPLVLLKPARGANRDRVTPMVEPGLRFPSFAKYIDARARIR